MAKTRAKYYVYSLSNPFNGKVFYIGKGCGNRINDHESEVRSGKGYNEAKLNIIRSILTTGKEVTKRIIRRFSDEAAAYKYETLLIKTIKGLTNIVMSQAARVKTITLNKLISKIVNQKVDRCYAMRHLALFKINRNSTPDHETLIHAVKKLANKNNWLVTECAYAK